MNSCKSLSQLGGQKSIPRTEGKKKKILFGQRLPGSVLYPWPGLGVCWVGGSVAKLLGYGFGCHG